MSQSWNDDKELEPITLIDCDGLFAIDVRTLEKNKYDSIVLGVIKKNKRESDNLKIPALKRVDFELVKEFPLSQTEKNELEVGKKIEVDTFSVGNRVKVVGTSKGKGTQGVVKRHNFAGGPKTHGHRHVLRSAGSIGSAFPEHVQKGKRMAGRMGDAQVTVKNLKVAWVDKEKAIIALKGAVPGRRGSWVRIIG